MVNWENIFSIAIVFREPTRESNAGQYLSGRRGCAKCSDKEGREVGSDGAPH